jgi:hypothetical protein
MGALAVARDAAGGVGGAQKARGHFTFDVRTPQFRPPSVNILGALFWVTIRAVKTGGPGKVPDDTELQVVKERLDVLIVLTAAQMRGEKEPKQLLASLAAMGVSRPTIARVLGMTVDAVKMALLRTGKASARSSSSGRPGGRGRRRSR